MKARTTITMTDGRIYVANFRGRSTVDIDRKVEALVWKLACSPTADVSTTRTVYRVAIPGAEFLRGTRRNVTGIFYRQHPDGRLTIEETN